MGFMKKRGGNKSGELLIGNVVFILLNLLFLTVLVIFLLKQGNGAGTLEQIYAKQIALVIDSAKPVMIIKMDMEKGMKIAEKNGVDFSEAVRITGNTVFVKLTEKGGYSYSFFNDINAVAYQDVEPGMYVLTINEE